MSSSPIMPSSSRPSRAGSTKARPDPLRRLASRGTDIVPQHLEAADRFRAAWERRDEAEVRRGLMAGRGMFQPLLLAVVIQRIDVAAWCRSQEPPRNPKTMLGALISIMDKLAALYGIETPGARAAAELMMRSTVLSGARF